jgi:ubiquinone/menaquinone biosynthesis C-methylase UbiE
MLTELPSEPGILDIGCGSGMQTIELVKLSGGQITAVDNHQPFWTLLKRQLQRKA